MNKNRLSLIIALAATLAVLAGGWFVGVQPQLARASENVSQQADIDATNERNRAELRRLEAAFSSLDTTKAELAELRKSIPASPDSAALLTQLNVAGTASGLTVTSITIGDPKSYVPVTATDTTASAAPTPAPSGSASAAPSTVPTPAAPAPHSDPKITSANFLVIPVTAAVKGSYDQAVGFTKRVQSGDRLFLVNGLAATSSDSGGDPMADQSWSLSGYVYVLADDPANG